MPNCRFKNISSSGFAPIWIIAWQTLEYQISVRELPLNIWFLRQIRFLLLSLYLWGLGLKTDLVSQQTLNKKLWKEAHLKEKAVQTMRLIIILFVFYFYVIWKIIAPTGNPTQDLWHYTIGTTVKLFIT